MADITWKPDVTYGIGERVWHVLDDEAYISRTNGNLGNEPSLDKPWTYWRPERAIMSGKPLLGPPAGSAVVVQRPSVGIGSLPGQNSIWRTVGAYMDNDGMVTSGAPRSTDLTEGSHLFRNTYLPDHEVRFNEPSPAPVGRPHRLLRSTLLGSGGGSYRIDKTALGPILTAETGAVAGDTHRLVMDHCPAMPAQALQFLGLIWSDKTDNLAIEIGFRQDDGNKVYFEVSTSGATSWPWACRYINNGVALAPCWTNVPNVAGRRAFAIGFWDGEIRFYHGNGNNTHVEVARIPVAYDNTKLYFPYVQVATLVGEMRNIRMTSLQMKVTG